MARGRDTHNMRIDSRVREEIIANVDQPDVLRQMFNLIQDVVFRRVSLAAYESFCKSMPCILWQPSDEGKRHVAVHVTRETERRLVHVARVVWVITHVTRAQGEPLMGYEELLHSCGRNGMPHTSFGTCLNPSHLVRSTAAARVKLRYARATVRAAIGEGVEQ